MKLVRLINMFLNETYSKLRIGKNLIHFIYWMVWNKEMLYHHCFSTLLRNMTSGSWNWMEHISCWSMLTLLT